MRGFIGLWIGIGFPIACFALIYDEHHRWMQNHPLLSIAAFVTLIGPLLIVGWLENNRRKT
jgi:hypothetical protein